MFVCVYGWLIDLTVPSSVVILAARRSDAMDDEGTAADATAALLPPAIVFYGILLYVILSVKLVDANGDK